MSNCGSPVADPEQSDSPVPDLLRHFLQSVAGLEFNREILHMAPHMPERWKKVQFNFAFRKNYYTFEIFSDRIQIKVDTADKQPVDINISGKEFSLDPDKKLEVGY